MKPLLKAILRHKKHLPLLAVSLVAILGITLTSQAEVFCLGLIAKPGPDTFLLFGKQQDGKLVKTKELSREQILAHWQEISPAGTITVADANAYITKYDPSARSITKRLQHRISQCLDLSNFYYLALFLLIVALTKATALFFQRFLAQAVAIRVSRDLRADYFKALQKLPMSFFHAYDMGNLSSRVITDSASIAQALNSLMVNYIQAPVILLVSLGVCLSISWRFSLVVCVAFPTFILPILLVAKKIKAVSKKIQKSQDKFTAALLDFLSGIMTVKIFRSEDFALKKYAVQNEEMAALEERNAIYGLLPKPLLHTVASLFFASIVVVGLYKFHIPPEELIVFCGLLYLVYDPVKKFAEENANIVKGVAAAERFYEVLAHPDLLSDAQGELTFTGLQQSIQFNHVSFSYENEHPVLNDITFSIKKGEAIGIVGPTGSGKTTLIKMLPRLYDASQGQIILDSCPITQYSKDSLREHIACVLQSPFLFYDTVWNNLTCGGEFSEQEVIDALKQAHAYEFVRTMPNGIHTFLEEAGKNLSGGQKQRLTIARALLRKTSILILDEATSFLDPISENYIKEIISGIKGQCTQIIIAHKLSTLEFVDKILYLEKGNLIATGSKEELLAICPQFQRMWELSASRDFLYPTVSLN